MRRRQRGQVAVELLVVAPVLVLVGLLAWQLVGVIAAGLRAEAQVRGEALEAVGRAGGTALVSATERVPSLIPGVAELRVRARAGVRLP